jgi:hypothetical protein
MPKTCHYHSSTHFARVNDPFGGGAARDTLILSNSWRSTGEWKKAAVPLRQKDKGRTFFQGSTHKVVRDKRRIVGENVLDASVVLHSVWNLSGYWHG